MRTLSLLAICCFACTAWTAEGAWQFQLDDKSLSISPPAGFVRMTPEMDQVQRFVQQMGDPMLEMVAYYIDERDEEIALAGEMPPLEYNCAILMNRQARDIEVNDSDFAEVCRQMIEENEQLMAETRAQMPEQMARLSQGVSNEFDVEVALDLTGMVPLPAHRQDDRALAYSMYLDYGMVMPGLEESFTTVATATIANVAGTVLFFYAYGPESELEWTRTTADEWVDQVLAQNDAPPEESSAFGLQSGGGGGYTGIIIGAAIGVVIFLLGRYRR